MFIRRAKDFDRFVHICWENDGSPSSATPPASGGLNSEAQRSFDNRLSKLEGNALGLAQQLYGENYSLREKVRSLEGRVHPEGATVLTGDDAKAWDVYKTLGKPEEVKQGLDQKGQLQGELDGLRRETILRRVAEVSQFRYSILADREKAARADGKTLAFEVREVEVEGVKTPVAYVKDGDVVKPVTDYAKEQWPDYLTVLQVTQGGDQQAASSAATASNGVRFIGQTTANGSNRGVDLVAKYQQEQAEAAKAIKNPLFPT